MCEKESELKKNYIGFGTYGLKGQKAYDVVLNALFLGADFIDLAEAYGNTEEVLSAIRDFAGYNQSEKNITVFYKMWDESSKAARYQSSRILSQLACHDSLILSTHWPPKDWRKTLYDYIDLKQHAPINIGLSNCSLELCETIAREGLSSYIWGLESEMHLYYKNDARVQFCHANGWHFISAAPLYRNKRTDPTLKTIAEKNNLSAIQVMLLWCIQNKTIPIPTTSNINHLNEILLLPDISIHYDDMIALNQIEEVMESERICFE